MALEKRSELTANSCPRCGSKFLEKTEITDLITLTCRSCGYQEKQLKRLT